MQFLMCVYISPLRGEHTCEVPNQVCLLNNALVFKKNTCVLLQEEHMCSSSKRAHVWGARQRRGGRISLWVHRPHTGHQACDMCRNCIQNYTTYFKSIVKHLPKALENVSQMVPKWNPNGAKMTPEQFLSPLRAPVHEKISKRPRSEPPKRALGGSVGGFGRPLGAFWRPLGACWQPLGT